MSSDDRRAAVLSVPALADISEQLEIFERLLVKWQGRLNLIGGSTLSHVWVRHFADSAQLAAAAPLDRRWADLGAGAGFPGLIIALLQRKCHAGEMHLIESDTRKAAFLREVSRETGAGAVVHNARCEDVLDRIKPDVISSRAMADLATLIRLTGPFVENGAICLFMKGRDVAAELTAASIPSSFTISLLPSKIDPESSLVRVQSI